MSVTRRDIRHALARFMGGDDYDNDPPLYTEMAEEIVRTLDRGDLLANERVRAAAAVAVGYKDSPCFAALLGEDPVGCGCPTCGHRTVAALLADVEVSSE